jgi:hypothetical protein
MKFDAISVRQPNMFVSLRSLVSSSVEEGRPRALAGKLSAVTIAKAHKETIDLTIVACSMRATEGSRA